MTYQPMRNAHPDFDPMGEEWGYILDSGCAPAEAWRGMVARNLRSATWPYKLLSDRHGRYGGARLAPDWCYWAWGREYVTATWRPEEPHLIRCRLTIGRRYANAAPEAEYAGHVILGLRGQTVTWLPAQAMHRDIPASVTAEAEHKGAKLLAFFTDAIGHWKAGDQEQPVQARDLYVLSRPGTGMS
jgi:hypothetical protein